MAIPSSFSLWPDHVLNHLAVVPKLMIIFLPGPHHTANVCFATSVAMVPNPLLGSLSYSYSLSSFPPFLLSPSFPSKIYIILVHRNICLFSHQPLLCEAFELWQPQTIWFLIFFTISSTLWSLFQYSLDIPMYLQGSRYSAWLRSLFSVFPTYLDWKVG